MRCVITQPTFLPWLGWFDLADQADVVVLLDDVQFAKRSWQQRNRIRTRNGLEFVSVPVKTAGRFDQRIFECELDEPTFFSRLLRTLRASYAKAPHSATLFPRLEALGVALAGDPTLLALNVGLIELQTAALGITTTMTRSSTLAAEGHRGEYLAAICESLGATEYLSTAGAEAYLIEDREAFDRRGIHVFIHAYQHPVYRQRFEPFMPYAAALDCLLNLGPEAGAVMRSGRQPSRVLGEEL